MMRKKNKICSTASLYPPPKQQTTYEINIKDEETTF